MSEARKSELICFDLKWIWHGRLKWMTWTQLRIPFCYRGVPILLGSSQVSASTFVLAANQRKLVCQEQFWCQNWGIISPLAAHWRGKQRLHTKSLNLLLVTTMIHIVSCRIKERLLFVDSNVLHSHGAALPLRRWEASDITTTLCRRHVEHCTAFKVL